MLDLQRLFERAVWSSIERTLRAGLVGRIKEAGGVQVTVPGKPNRLYIRLGDGGTDGVIEAFAVGVAARAHAPVTVFKLWRQWIAIGALSTASETYSGGNRDAGTVGFHTHKIGSGREYMVEALRLEPGRVRFKEALTVTISPFRYPTGASGETYIGGDLDLTSNLPGTAGKWAWIVVGIDAATNTAVAVTGGEFDTQAELTLAEIDNVAFVGDIPLCAIQAKNGDTTLNAISRYYDARTWFVPSDMIDQDIFWLLAGRTGGQTAYGGTGPGDDVIIESTSDVTKGDVIIQPNGGNVGVGLTPTVKFETYLDGETYVERTTRQTIQTTNARSVKKFIAHSEGDMVDGFGPTIDFGVNDTAAIETLLGRIGSVRDGADTEGALIFQAGTNGIEEFARITSTGRLGIQTTTPGAVVEVSGTHTASPAPIMFRGRTTINSADVNNQYGFYNDPRFSPTGASLSNIYAFLNVPIAVGSSITIANMIGLFNRVDTSAAFSGVITNARPLQIGNGIVSGGSIANYHGIYINDLTVGTSTNVGINSNVSAGAGKHNLYIAGSAENYLEAKTGIGRTPVTRKVEIAGSLSLHTDDSNYMLFNQASATQTLIQKVVSAGQALIDFDPLPGDGTSLAFFRFFRSTNTSGGARLDVHIGDGTSTLAHRFESNGRASHLVQSTTAAVPPLSLKQSDVSEPFINFATTIGVGNAIENVGAKSLTVTEFVKIETPNGIRYLQAGTIA